MDRTKSRSRGRQLFAGIAAVALAGLGLGVVASTAGASKPDSNGMHKVTLCHRTNSNTNPYVVITVDVAAADGSLGKGGSDHTHHEGPVWNPTLKDSHTKWGDIIPPYTYNGRTFPGQNWDDDGQAFHENGCEIPPPCPPSDSRTAEVSVTDDECPPECPPSDSRTAEVGVTNDDCPPQCPPSDTSTAEVGVTNDDSCPPPPCPNDPTKPATDPTCYGDT